MRLVRAATQVAVPMAATAPQPPRWSSSIRFPPPTSSRTGGRWNEAFAALETERFAPALAALQAGQLGELGLTLCGDTGSVTLTVTRGDLRKFWRRRVLASLFIE